MDILNEIAATFMVILYYLPTMVGELAHANVNLGLGLDQAQLVDAFAGCEVCGLVIVGFLVIRRMLGHEHAAPAPVEVAPADEAPAETTEEK